MRRTISSGAVAVHLVLSVACGGSTPTLLTETPVTSPSPIPPSSPFPPLSGPSRTFIFDNELLYPVRDYTKGSRFVLYENGAFVLQYPNGQYRGGYTRDNDTIMLAWESSAGQWRATGTLNGDSLTVRYNFVMQLDDFEDAVYVLME